MPPNWAGLQARSAPTFTLLLSNASRDHQASPSRTDVPWPQVSHKIAGRSHSSTTGFWGTVSAWPREEAANEGARRQDEERENFEYTGWRCSAGETRTQQQGLIALWGRAAGGTVQKRNSSCGQKERWQHRHKVDGTLQEGTLLDSGGGRQMEARTRFWSQSQRKGASYQGCRNILRKYGYPRWSSQILRTERSHPQSNNYKSGLLIKSWRLEISELRNYFTKI